MQRQATPTRTPIYRNAPISASHSPLSDAGSINDHSASLKPGAGASMAELTQYYQNASWDTLRKDARQLETEVESKLTVLSKFGVVGRAGGAGSENGNGAGVGSSSAAGSSSSANGGQEVQVDIDSLLERLNCLVDAMADHLDKPTVTATASMRHVLQRHRDVLYDYTKEYRKTVANVRSARDHAELLSSVRDDINRSRNGQGGSGSGMSASDMLLNERSRIDGSHSLADSALEQAYATKDDLDRQRSTLLSVNRRITNVAEQLPGVGQLIGKIQSRKARDNVILSAVIGSCVVFVLWATVL